MISIDKYSTSQNTQKTFTRNSNDTICRTCVIECIKMSIYHQSYTSQIWQHQICYWTARWIWIRYIMTSSFTQWDNTTRKLLHPAHDRYRYHMILITSISHTSDHMDSKKNTEKFQSYKNRWTPAKNISYTKISQHRTSLFAYHGNILARLWRQYDQLSLLHFTRNTNRISFSLYTKKGLMSPSNFKL